jgi:hypothetical protein
VNGHGSFVAALGMHGMNPEDHDPEIFNYPAATETLFREEPDEEEEDEGDGNGDDDEAEEGDGYSE